MPTTFARRFKLLRETKGWSVRGCAANLEISPSAVQKYEKGTTDPTLKMVLRMSKGFGVSPVFFLADPEDPSQPGCEQESLFLPSGTCEEKRLVEDLENVVKYLNKHGCQLSIARKTEKSA